MPVFDAFVVDPSYVVEKREDGSVEAVVLLWSRLSDGRSALVRKPFKPYFFVKKSDKERVSSLSLDVSFSLEECGFKEMIDREPVLRVVLDNPRDVPVLRKSFESEGVSCFEADIRFAYRAMMDWGVMGSFRIDGSPSPAPEGVGVDVVFDDPLILPPVRSFFPSVRVLSFDLESDKDSGSIFCVSFFGRSFSGSDSSSDVFFERRVIVSDSPVEGAVVVPDEASLISEFVKAVREFDPDVITGWNVIDFDLSLLRSRARKFNVPLVVGRDGSELSVRLEKSFFRDSSARVSGRVVLDGIHLLKNNFIRLDDYKLDTAAKRFSKDQKLIQSTGKEKYDEILRLYDHDKVSLLDYNFLDAKLVVDILDNSGAFVLTVKRSLLTGMPLDRVSASIAAFDSLYLRELRKRGFVAPSVGSVRDVGEGLGGFVRQPVPGLYDFVAVFDFKSLYPSIMRTFNIDPLTFVDPSRVPEGVSRSELIEAPNGALFRREPGIVPDLLSVFWSEREAARKRGDELARYAIKIHMNSIYGVLASPNCRFFNRLIGNAITSFAQFLIKLVARTLEDRGFKVIYGDTDSVFVDLKTQDYDEAFSQSKSLEASLNAFLRDFVRERYSLDSFLELEFEKLFVKFFMPPVRGQSDQGAKKRYAGLLRKPDGSEELSFTGLEVVRRDWTDLAKEFQVGLYKRLFAGEDVKSFIKSFVSDLRSGKLDDLLVYRKALRKPVSSYTKTTPPHVKAARLLDSLDSNIVEYVMTVNGPEPIQNLSSSIDYDHYVEKQLKPIADSILPFFNTSFDDLLNGDSQRSIFDY